MFYWKIFGSIFLISLSLYLQQPSGNLEVHFLNVGQGDGAFIRSPLGYNIIIDGGPDLSLLDNLETILPPQDHTIDLLILTHPHSDHLFGLIEILERYKVKNALLTGVAYKSKLYTYFESNLAKKGPNLLFADSNQDIYFNDGLLLDVIYPHAPSLAKTVENVNNDSIVIRLVYGQNSILFTGDAEIEEEREILQTASDVETQILKAGHHGSKTSSTSAYLPAVRPEYAIISAGENNQYHHPHGETLQNFVKAGIQALRTDQLGNITMIFDEKELLAIL